MTAPSDCPHGKPLYECRICFQAEEEPMAARSAEKPSWDAEVLRVKISEQLETIRELRSSLSLAQAEIKGHMRIEDELKAALIASEEFGAREHGRLLEALSRNLEAQSRIAELEEDALRYRWLRMEGCNIFGDTMKVGDKDAPVIRSMETLDEEIDAYLKDRA